MPTPPVKDRHLFVKVKAAREELAKKAGIIFDEYMDVIAKAKDAGDYETAAKHLQWLIDHMPADNEGDRMIDQSVDKKQEVISQLPVGPNIQIGIKVGGSGDDRKSLPSVEVVDIKPKGRLERSKLEQQ